MLVWSAEWPGLLYLMKCCGIEPEGFVRVQGAPESRPVSDLGVPADEHGIEIHRKRSSSFEYASTAS
jgi:hypothetical protein